MHPARAERQGDLIAHAYDRLRQLIVWGRLSPGSRIIESDIARRLEMSRTPVRSALQRLQQEGYIAASEGGKQARLTVVPLTAEDGEELFWVVGELEGLAADLAARKSPEERKEIVDELRDINRRLQEEATTADPDPQAIFDLHTHFHLSYVEAAAKSRLLNLLNSIKPQAERYRRVYSSALGGDIRPSIEEHERIIAHIEAGDPDAAARAVRENWRNAADRLRHIIRVIGERGAW